MAICFYPFNVGIDLVLKLDVSILLLNKQNCPKCNHLNDSYHWDFKRTHVHMECVVCGKHWFVDGANSITERAANGIAVIDEMQIENPAWNTIPVPFSKSAITANVFDKKKQFTDFEPYQKPNTKSLFPIHIFSIAIVFLALITAPQLKLFTPEENTKLIAAKELDPITTASLPSVNKTFKIYDVKLMKIVRGKARYIKFWASARNVSGRVMVQPKFRVFMKTTEGKTLQILPLELKNKNIKPGEIVSINSEVLDETGSTKSVSIAFQE